MEIGMIGLGRMGMNMVRRLLQSGHEVVAYNRTPQKTEEIAREGAVAAYSLSELAEAAFSKDVKLTGIRGYVEDSGEGRWTVNQALETGVSAPVITLSLMNRFRSRDKDSFSDRVVAALRREFGGHAVVTSEKE